MPLASLRRQKEISFSTVSDFVDGIFGEDMHAKCVESLACATLGALASPKPMNSSKNIASSS